MFFLVAETDLLFQAWTDILRQVLFYFKPALAPVVAPGSPSNSGDLRKKKPILEGWLSKQGGQNKTWKNRWFVLREKSLTYFESSAESTTESLAKGVIDLTNAHIQLIEDHKFSFCFAINTDLRVYFLLAKDRADLDKWVDVLKTQMPTAAMEMDDSSRSSEGLAKYHAAVMDKWNAITHQKPTVRVGAAELAQGAMAGFLLKASKALTDRTNTVKNWQSRYFVLKNHCLYYFKGPMEDEALGTIELANIEIEKIADNAEGKCSPKKVFFVMLLFSPPLFFLVFSRHNFGQHEDLPEAMAESGGRHGKLLECHRQQVGFCVEGADEEVLHLGGE